MSLDDLTTQEKLTPEERRGLLRAFADRMLLKVTVMDDPADMPGVEKAMRVAAVIERVYSRCDRAERQKQDKVPDPRKLEAERATNEVEAIKARVSLAKTMEWGENRRRDLGQWWDAAQNITQSVPATLPAASTAERQTPAPTQTTDMAPGNSKDHIFASGTDPKLRKQSNPQPMPANRPSLRGPPFE